MIIGSESFGPTGDITEKNEDGHQGGDRRGSQRCDETVSLVWQHMPATPPVLKMKSGESGV